MVEFWFFILLWVLRDSRNHKIDKSGITTWLLARYMDDARAFLPPFRPGWRWGDSGLQFCQEWAQEDNNTTPTELTKRILAGSMANIEPFLEFTFETCDQFGGWLPTLDTCIGVDQKTNVVEYN